MHKTPDTMRFLEGCVNPIQYIPDAAKFCGEAFLHAAISCYAQANEKWLAGDTDAARHFTKQALELSQNATKVYPQLAEAFYHHAKFAALLNDGETAQNSLKTAILTDRNYCIKADVDRDFDGVREYVRNLFESLRQQAKQKTTPPFESMKRILEDWNFQCPEAKEAEPEIRKLFQQAESLYRRDTYFDYLDALPLLEKAQQIFDPIPQKEKLYQQAKEEAKKAFESVKKLLEDWVFQGTAKQAESEIRNLLQRAESLYRRDTYSDYLDALPLLKEAQKIFDRIPPFVEFTTLTGYSDWVYSVAFSPDSRYLASGSEDRTVKIWVKGVISRQELEDQEQRRIEVEKEIGRRRKEQELREYRLKNKMCLECGKKLSFLDKLSGAEYCKRHKR